MIPLMAFIAAAGLAGGLVRGLVGVLKSLRQGRKFRLQYFGELEKLYINVREY